MLPQKAVDFIRNEWPHMLCDPAGHIEKQTAARCALRLLDQMARTGKFSEVNRLILPEATFVIILKEAGWKPGDTILLRNVKGHALMTGTDVHGHEWVEFRVDHFAAQGPGECDICGAKIPVGGWTCLDGFGEVCVDHVEFWKDWVEGEK